MATITTEQLDELVDKAGAHAAALVGGYLSPLFPAQAEHQLERLLTELNVTEIIHAQDHDQAVH